MIKRSLSTLTKALPKERWPKQKTNTILNICPQQNAMIVERLGKLHTINKDGFFFAIPFVDQIKYCIDCREQTLDIVPLKVISSDNVALSVAGTLFYQIIDPEKACYGCNDPIEALTSYAQSSMRNSLGQMDLDIITKNRHQINSKVLGSFENALDKWGVTVKRFELTEVSPSADIVTAMNNQSISERIRRGVVLDSEGKKKSAELISEGEKIKLINESEGHYTKVINEAKAKSESIEIQAQAMKRYVEIIASSLNSETAKTALVYSIAEKQIEMMGKIGSTSNTMFFSDKPVNPHDVISQAQAIMSKKIV
jgi:regulator of protease activity HflC (stomatin/prohibitin superfamily)